MVEFSLADQHLILGSNAFQLEEDCFFIVLFLPNSLVGGGFSLLKRDSTGCSNTPWMSSMSFEEVSLSEDSHLQLELTGLDASKARLLEDVRAIF